MLLLSTSVYYPFVVLLLGILFVIAMIAALRMHAFIALVLAAIFVGLISDNIPGSENLSHYVKAIEVPMTELGNTAGKIGFVIGLAAIIGMALMESGAADTIVRKFLSVMGEKRAGTALLISGFFLAIPVFFDTVFFLLIPLAIALSTRLKGNYMYYVMAICGGGAITHALVAPTPGPLIMAEEYGIDLGISILGGIVAGILPAIMVLWLGKKIDQRVPATVPTQSQTKDFEQEAATGPSFLLSVMPIVLPVVLIAITSFFNLASQNNPAFAASLQGELSGLNNLVSFLGNKNIALFIGASIAIWVMARQKGLNLRQLTLKVESPLATAGVIILITSAGGAFGAMIKHSGIGDAILAAADGQSINFIILAWVISAAMKVAQGSSTVAMITTANIMVPLVGDGSALSYPLLFIFLATGFGSLAFSWMNDSGFWVVGKMSGFTEKQTLRSWTVLLTAIALLGLVELLLLSVFF